MLEAQSSAKAPFDVLDPVAQRKCQLLQRGRAGLANVIAAHRDWVVSRNMVRTELKGIDHQLHRRANWIDPFFLSDVFFEDVVLQSSGNLFPVGALLLGNNQIHSEENGGWRVNCLRYRSLLERNAVEQNFHVRQRRNGDAAFSDFPFGERRICVIAHQGRQVIGDRQTGLALFQKVLESRIRFFWRPKTGELPHCPNLAAVTISMNAAGVWKHAWCRDVSFKIYVCGVGR